MAVNSNLAELQVQAEEIQEVQKKDISECTVEESLGKIEDIMILQSQRYTGSWIEPSITIKDGDYTLVEDVDYVVFSDLDGCNNRDVNVTPWKSYHNDYKENCPYIFIGGIGNYQGEQRVVFAILSEGQKETEDHLIYSDKEVLAGYDGVTIDGYVGTEKEVRIPDYIDGKPVQEINQEAFSYNYALEKIDISDNVFQILKNAFVDCKNLKEVKLSNQLWGIGECAFSGCLSLKQISLPKTLEVIENHIFCRCLSMEAIYSESDIIYAVDGVLYCKDLGKNDLYFYPPARQAENFFIPDGVERIWSDAFRDVGCINNIVIPSSVNIMFSGKYGSLYGIKNPVNIVYKHDVPCTLVKGILGPNTFYDLPAGSTVTVKNEEMKEAAESAISEQCRGNVTVLIDQKPAVSLACTETDITLSKGAEHSLSWTQTPADTTDYVTWKSSDETVAKVDPVIGKITAEGYGRCTVTGTDESGHIVKVDILVYDPCTSHSFTISGFSSDQDGKEQSYENATECVADMDKFTYLHAEASADGYAGAMPITFTSSDTSIVTVRPYDDFPEEIWITPVSAGTATITATFDDNGTKITDTVTVHVYKKEQTEPPSDQPVKKQNQKLQYKKSYQKAYGSKTFSLDVKRIKGNGKLSYSSSNKKVAVVSSKGKVSIKGTGRAVVTVTAAETEQYKKKSIKLSIDITPKKQAVSLKVTKERNLVVKWKKDTKATGYQVQCSTTKNFKKNVQTAAIGKNRTISKTFKKLKKGKTYYVRVRSYKAIKVEGKEKKLYSSWANVKRSKIK